MNLAIISIPFLLAFAGALALKTKKSVEMSSLVISLFSGASLFAYLLPFVMGRKAEQASEWWMIDSFSALVALLIAVVYVAALLVALRYIGHEYEEKIITLKQYKLFFALYQLFVFCMVLVPLTNNSLLLWLALECTTLFSTFLVGLYHKKTSIEAAWKYMILCSTGISLGLVGMLLMSYGAHVAGVAGHNVFTISSLMENAGLIPANIIKLSFVFLFIGFGTKVGLVPMHTWLPDAHSKAPSPISAIFSAVLLNVALYAMLRYKFIADTGLGAGAWSNHLFLIFGFLSVLLSAFMMLIQENYKRMLAYSSIEHMGLVVFAMGLSPIGAMFGLMHMIGHTLTKSALFFGAGEILIHFKSTKIPKIKNMLGEMKYTSIMFLLGIVFIVAMPPSVLFVSEYGMFSQIIGAYPKTALALFLFLGIIAYGMLSLTVNMVLAGKSEAGAAIRKEKWNITHSIIAAEFAALFLLAFYFTTSSGTDMVANIVNDFLFIK